MEDPGRCYDFDPDVESVSHSMVKQAVLDASIKFKRVAVARDGDSLRIRVGMVAVPDEEERRAHIEVVATALTVMNQECLCLSEGTRMLLTFEEM
jgi:hypothetical protein